VSSFILLRWGFPLTKVLVFRYVTMDFNSHLVRNLLISRSHLVRNLEDEKRAAIAAACWTSRMKGGKKKHKAGRDGTKSAQKKS